MKNKAIIIGKTCEIHGFWLNGFCSDKCKDEPLRKYDKEKIKLEYPKIEIFNSDEKLLLTDIKKYGQLCCHMVHVSNSNVDELLSVSACVIYEENDVKSITLTCFKCIHYFVYHRLLDSSNYKTVCFHDRLVLNKNVIKRHYQENSTFRPTFLVFEKDSYLTLVNLIFSKFFLE